MSVVLAAAQGSSIQRTLVHLGEQSASRDLELVIVTDAPDARALLDPQTEARFGSHQIVRVSEIRSKAIANAEGFRHARAPVVVFAEDHCFADPGWAEALIRRHEIGCAAAAPRIRNANPATALSWCDLLINYGPWLETSGSATREALPGHNCSYKKEILEGYDERLAEWLDVESELHLEMAGRGLTLQLESDAETLCVSAKTWEDEVMGIQHRAFAESDAPVEGIQFHPESIDTDQGLRMLQNFLEMVGVQC